MMAKPRLLLSSLVGAFLWLLLMPGEALAWGPATHIAIGEAVLSSVHLLPPAAQELLRRHPVSFLYGGVAADISFGKKYAPAGRHCHHWHVGEEIQASADTPELQAVSLGYLSHLAADTVAHNYYVPRRLLLTSTTQALGHTYWEHRMDLEIGDPYLTRARQVVLEADHQAADAHFDRVLSRTLFSFRTNRRIFRGMVAIQDRDRWKRMFGRVVERSRFEFPRPLRDRYIQLSYEYVMEYLARGEESRAAELDPIGDENLGLAKTIRRRGMARGGFEDPEILQEWADDFFPIPTPSGLFLPRAAGRIDVPGLRATPDGRLEADARIPEGKIHFDPRTLRADGS
ncbi:MAG: hypothetical protein EA352_00255 [Gemmatimonadales bacterium]|nr:MAG: hypothetical protein EA352_00255 [Gemmatimonadales bacterium]